MTTEKRKNKPELVWVSAGAVSIHPMAEKAFNIAQKFCYQADTTLIPVNFFGSRSYDLPFAIEGKEDEDYQVFAGWESIQQQFFNKQQIIPISVIQQRVSTREIEQQAWAYLLTQISRTLSENTFLVHTYQLAMEYEGVSKIVELPKRLKGKPHLIAEHIHQVGRKRSMRQLKKFQQELIVSMHGGF
ncbi:MAG: hypothetical protein AAF431_14415 [Pseudomonadota bacterium]